VARGDLALEPLVPLLGVPGDELGHAALLDKLSPEVVEVGGELGAAGPQPLVSLLPVARQRRLQVLLQLLGHLARGDVRPAVVRDPALRLLRAVLRDPLLGLFPPGAQLLEAGVVGLQALRQAPERVGVRLALIPGIAGMLLEALLKLLHLLLEARADPLGGLVDLLRGVHAGLV